MVQLIGVDIGGTFTDLVLNVNGQLTIHKLLSTPDDPSQAMLAGIVAVSSAAHSNELLPISHGSTVATNALLERKGAKTALITTKGFRDILLIGRQNRPDLYALHPTIPAPLISRQHGYEVSERLDYTGSVLTPLDLSELDSVLDRIVQEKFDSVAVCFLFSYANPSHEQAVRTRILERNLLESWQIALSHEVLPAFREYERASTTAVEAYVRPLMSKYLSHLEQSLKDHPLRVMKSDGGVISARNAREHAVQTVLSGPAAGVIGAFYLAQQAGFDHIITLDIGGTSTDVALCPGKPILRSEAELDGQPLHIRLLDIETVGAGGGSIARVDVGGALRVGPQSAGAMPGPIIYGRGGSQITVSDANAILGRLDPNHFLGGSMSLAVDTAIEALKPLAAQIDRDLETAALGIIQVANVNIERAIRQVSIARGYDPRQFTLVAFGGAGPLHACEVAARLDIPRIMIPRYPGVLCAYGLLAADVARDYSVAILSPVTDRLLTDLAAKRSQLIETAQTHLASENIPESRMRFEFTLDMHYKGQAYELSVPYQGDVVEEFHIAHQQAYGHAMRDRSIEIVNLRLLTVGQTEKPPLIPVPLVNSDGSEAYLGEKTVILEDGAHQVGLYQRERLQPGAAFSGPALIFQMDTTVFIPDNWSVRIDGYANLVVESHS